MSEKVINIEERMPHKTGPALCSACGKTWIFTAPIKTMTLECPNCGKMTGGEQEMKEESEKYDFYLKDLQQHRAWVAEGMHYIIREIATRSHNHDDSKMSEIERDAYIEPVWQLNHDGPEYGTEEYKALCKQMGEGWKHHIKHNDHHPEHFDNDLSKMNLVQLIEMVCDWRAASKRKGNHPAKAIEFMKAELSPQLEAILRNTIDAYLED